MYILVHAAKVVFKVGSTKLEVQSLIHTFEIQIHNYAFYSTIYVYFFTCKRTK